MSSFIENVLFVNHPINRLEFFKYTGCMAVIQLILSVIFIILTENIVELQFIITPVIFSLIVIFPLLYLYFVQFSKRLWDITENKHTSIISGLIIFTVSVVGIIVFPVLTIAIYLTLILLPGKIVVNE